MTLPSKSLHITFLASLHITRTIGSSAFLLLVASIFFLISTLDYNECFWFFGVIHLCIHLINACYEIHHNCNLMIEWDELKIKIKSMREVPNMLWNASQFWRWYPCIEPTSTIMWNYSNPPIMHFFHDFTILSVNIFGSLEIIIHSLG